MVKKELKGSIQTFSNIVFYPLNPNPEDILIEDIARGLAMKCRFSGQCTNFISVAQHSVNVSYICEPKDALWGLLHDASEAYIVDMPSPLKVLWQFFWFRKIENKLQKTIYNKFGLYGKEPDSVHWADKVMLSTEKRDFTNKNQAWESLKKYPPIDVKLPSWNWQYAEYMFLKRFDELTNLSNVNYKDHQEFMYVY